MADDKKTDYTKYLSSRNENLGKLVNALRADPVLLAEFGKSPMDVSKRFALTIAQEDAQKITDLVIANPAVGELDANLLEAVAGGSNWVGCEPNLWKCG
jgi:hypothetical protein